MVHDQEGPRQHEGPTGANPVSDEGRGVSWCRPSNEFQRFEAANPTIWLPAQSAAS
jgi:hypothetical protein